MAGEKKNWLGPYIPEGSFIRELLQQLRLAYHLMLDARVPALAKLIPIASFAYLLFPVDLSPDVVPVLGQLDDLAVVLLGLRVFFEVSPPEVVREHLRRLAQTIQSNWEAANEPSPPPAAPPDPNIVEGTFRRED